MAKINLSEEDLKILSECINNETEIPEQLLMKLSPGFFEKLRQQGRFDYKELDKYKIPTIEYAGKRSESVILAQATITGGAAPLQIVRNFGSNQDNDWRNMIVQGDNLQFLKTCYMNQDPLIKDKVKGKVKLIYIDPPFATKSDFGGKEGEFSYADKVDRAEFLESLRERLIYMREILAEDGSIYVHLDQKMSHYVKVIVDEIFGKENFANEIIWFYPDTPGRTERNFNAKHDNILRYTKRENNYVFNADDVREEILAASVERYKKSRILGGREYIGGKSAEMGKVPEDVWRIPSVKGTTQERTEYVTQKPEALLNRIIQASSNVGDIILDCFAGSGTTAAVAEKLGRRWIMCDFGKHAIYTMQKRMLNIAESKKLGPEAKKNEKHGNPPKPFSIVSAGAYDFSKIMNLRQNKEAYISFVLGLFGITRENVDFSRKFKLPNIYAEKEGNPVEVYPVWQDEYLKDIRIDEEYLRSIITASGGKLKGDYHIVTPETCTIIGDTALKNANKENVNFYMLKFPYKVLEDISRRFQIEEQPASGADINKLISSTGFYFNEDVSLKLKKEKEGLRIESFSTKILDANKERFQGLEGLAMVLIDKDYNGEVFNLSEAIYSKDIEDGLIKIKELTKNTAVIAIDKHGNESKVVRV